MAQPQAPGRALALKVGPSRAGDEHALVELVFEEPQAGFLLSGSAAMQSYPMNGGVIDPEIPPGDGRWVKLAPG